MVDHRERSHADLERTVRNARGERQSVWLDGLYCTKKLLPHSKLLCCPEQNWVTTGAQQIHGKLSGLSDIADRKLIVRRMSAFFFSTNVLRRLRQNELHSTV